MTALNNNNNNNNSHGIYFLIKQGCIIYIGQTQDLKTRLQNHADKDFDAFRFISCEADKLNYYESRWITRFRPSLNKTNKAYFNRGVKKHPGRVDIRLTQEIHDMAINKAKSMGMNFNQYIVHLIHNKCND